MTRVVVALCVLLMAIAYYSMFYPPVVKRKAAEAALYSFAEAVASHDRGRIGEVLEKHLDGNVSLQLEVQFLSLTQNGSRPVIQDFDKPAFLRFVDNIIYAMEDYGYRARLEHFALAPDGQTAQVIFSSGEWADGKSYYGGVSVMMRFSSDTRCEGAVTFTEAFPRISSLRCVMSLRSVPRPEESHKIRENPEALKQLLMR